MSIKSKVINFIRGVIVLIAFAVAICIANRLLMHKSEDGYDQMQSYYKQIDYTVDVLFLGSSKIYCQIDTGILWDEHGISAFDLGGAEAPPWNSYYFMKEALKTQKPKVILYDATIIGFRQDVLYQPEVWSMTNGYGMHWNPNRIMLLRENAETDDLFKRLLFPLDTMHSRYKELTKNDFVDENNTINYKGFDYRNTVVEFERPDVSDMTESFVFDEKHEKYLRKMINLSKENNIPFIVMITPYVVTPEHQGYFNYVEDICNEEGITYIDFNKMYDDLGINFATDMAENVHLNFSGTKKLTEYLGNYIVSNFDVKDHRGDEKYSSWDVDAEINRENRQNAAPAPEVDEVPFVQESENTEKRIVCWGDSLTEGTCGEGVTMPGTIAELSGLEVLNYGGYGESSSCIAARQGGNPQKLVEDIVIPASCTPVKAQCEGDYGYEMLLVFGDAGINNAMLGDIEGTYTMENDERCFTRSFEGDEIIIPAGTQLVTYAMLDKRENDILVIWAGSNDGVETEEEITSLSKKIDKMIEYQGGEEYIVISLTSRHSRIPLVDKINEDLQEHYGEHYLDLRSYLVDEALNQLEITPTELDEKAIEIRDVPYSLRASLDEEENHGNSDFYRIAGEQVYNKLVELKYIEAIEE